MQDNFKRIDYLDSVRGIAAMMVVVYHFMGGKWSYKPIFHVASMVFNGSDAVSFFFVLSGFVLSFKYFQSTSEIDIRKYIITRAFRIYPAFIFTVLLNFLYVNRQSLNVDLLKEMFYYNSQELWQELALVRNVHKFYLPGWTLGIEMALSLLMPLLIAAARKDIKYVAWLLPISIFMGAGYISPFIFHFCLGMVLAYFYQQIRELNFREHKLYPYRFLLFGTVFLMFSIRHIDRLYPFGETFNKYSKLYNIDLFHVTGLASFLILGWIINNNAAQKVLSAKPLIFLGKISYSLYLMHWMITAFVMDYWDAFNHVLGSWKVTFLVMFPATVLASVLAATLVYNFIEKPFIKVCNSLTRKPQPEKALSYKG